MPKIDTLLDDIREVLTSPQGEERAKEAAMEIGVNVGHRMLKALNRVERARADKVLYPAELGSPCARKVWYSFHYNPMHMEPKEQIGPGSKLKFMYGDVIESILIPLVKLSGHTVDHVDEKVQWDVPGMDGWIVRGKIDLCIDGHTVDVKSMAARSFDRWAASGIAADSFGYSYQVAAYERVLMSGKPSYILAIDKEGGKMGLHETKPVDVGVRAYNLASLMGDSDRPPLRLSPEPDGKSGNLKLGMVCSYCDYKNECWKDSNAGAGLRKFHYSFGPVWLTKVVYEPRVPEATGS